jgi:uncharacterized protein (TIGR03435 family)
MGLNLVGRASVAVLSGLTVVSCTKFMAQTTISSQETPTYDIASVKQNLNPIPAWRMNFTTDGVSAQGVTLEYAIQEAFGVYDDRLWSGGPGWIKDKRFDINAKFDISKYPNPTLDQRKAMLQQLLADRFKLKVHHENRQFSLYALVISKHGILFKETNKEDLQTSPEWGVICMHTRSRRGVLEMTGCPMNALASSLDLAAGDLGRKVVDQTGLTGHFDFKLSWTPMMTNGPSVNDANGTSSGPSIFTAVREQLGLELKPITAPLDTIVIDHVEMPSEN